MLVYVSVNSRRVQPDFCGNLPHSPTFYKQRIYVAFLRCAVLFLLVYYLYVSRRKCARALNCSYLALFFFAWEVAPYEKAAFALSCSYLRNFTSLIFEYTRIIVNSRRVQNRKERSDGIASLSSVRLRQPAALSDVLQTKNIRRISSLRCAFLARVLCVRLASKMRARLELLVSCFVFLRLGSSSLRKSRVRLVLLVSPQFHFARLGAYDNVIAFSFSYLA